MKVSIISARLGHHPPDAAINFEEGKDDIRTDREEGTDTIRTGRHYQDRQRGQVFQISVDIDLPLIQS